MTIEQVIRVVFDDSAYTRNVAQAASATSNFDARVSSVTAGLTALTTSAGRAGSAQALAANSGGAFLAALQNQSRSLTQQSAVIGKTEADLLRLKAAELGVATQAESTIASLERQNAAIAKLSSGAKAIEAIGRINLQERVALGEGLAVDVRAGRATQAAALEDQARLQTLARLAAAESEYRSAVESGIVTDLKAARSNQEVIAAQRQRTAELAQAAAAEAEYRQMLAQGRVVDLQAARAQQAASRVDRERNAELVQAAAAESEYRRAVEAGTVSDLKAARAKQDLISQIEREAAAIRNAATASRESGPRGVVADRARELGATDPSFAARAQPALANLAAAQGQARAAQDAARLEAEINRLAATVGKSRAEILRMDLAAAGLGGRFEAQIAKIAAVDKSFQSFNKTGRLTALELQQVGFQLNDFFVQVVSGGNPIIALVQQGSQLSGTFGGIGSAVRALASLITPTVAALGALAGGLGVFAFAAASTEKWSRALGELQAALAGTGRAGQIGNTGLSQLIEELSQAPGVTRDAATKSIAELARANKIGVDLFAGLSRAAVDYAKITGTDLPAATKSLVTALSEPAAGVKSVSEALGTLSAGTITAVERLERLGDRLGAQRYLLDAIRDATKGAAETGLTPFQTATNELGNSWDRLMGTFRESEGLKQAVGYVASFIGLIDKAIKSVDDIDRKFGTLNVPFALGVQAGDATRRFLGISNAASGGGGDFSAPRGGGGAFDTGVGGAGASFAEGPEVAIQSESKAREALLVRVKAATDGYKSEGRELVELREKRNQLTNALKVAAQQGYTPNSQLVEDFKDKIVAIDKRIADALKRGGADSDRELLRSTAAAIEQARRSAQAQVAVKAEENEALRGEYEAGLIDVATYYKRREELAAQAAAAQQTRLDSEKAAQQRRLTEGRRPETRAAAADALQTFPDLRETAAAEAARAIRRLENDELRETTRLQKQIAQIDAEIAQLAGDELTAERQRNQTILERIRLSASQTFGPSDSQTQIRVQAAEELLARQERFNDLQRQTSRASEQAAIKEQAFLVAAQARGDSQEEIERGLYAIRREQLTQLDELARKARELAENSTDPRILAFADQMALAYRRAADEVEPALAKMRSAVDEAAQAIGAAGGEIVLNFRNAKQAVESLEQTLLRIGTKVLIEEPITKSARDFFKGITEGQGGAGDFFRNIFRVGSGPIDVGRLGGVLGGPSVIDTSGAGTASTPSLARDALRQLEGSVGDADKAIMGLTTATSASSSVLSLLPQAAAIPATSGMAAVGAAAPTAAAGLAQVAAAAAAAAASLSTLAGGAAGSSGFGLLNLGGLIGGGGGFGTGANFGNLDLGQFFDEGGYTGDGPASQPAGIVHKGEHVMPQARVSEPGALQFLETVRAVGLDRALSAMSPPPASQAFGSAVPSPPAAIGGMSVAPVTGGTISHTLVERIASSAKDPSQILVGGFTGVGGKLDVAGAVGAGDYVTPMDRVQEPNTLAFLEVMRKSGLRGALQATIGQGRLPGYVQGGLVGSYARGGLVDGVHSDSRPAVERLTQQAASPSQAGDDGARGRQVTVNVSVTAPQGGSRETALQFGRTVGQQVQIALRRNA